NDLVGSDVAYLPVSRLLADRWVNHDDFYFTADIEFLGNTASLRQGEAVSRPAGPLNLNSCGFDRGNRIRTLHPLCVMAFLKLLDHTLQVGIASIKGPREQGVCVTLREGRVPTPLGNSLPVRGHLELTCRARYSDGFNA